MNAGAGTWRLVGGGAARYERRVTGAVLSQRGALRGAALALVTVAACGGDAASPKGAADSGAGGDAGATEGGSFDSGGASAIMPRGCGSNARCNAGATCVQWTWELGDRCECDPTGHFLCVPVPGGGAGPSFVCSEGETCPLQGAAASGMACSTSNTFCTRSCQCEGGQLACDVTCDGKGVEADGHPCARSSCQTDLTDISSYWGGCSFDDGACTYEITCGGDDTGSCPP